ncbi:apolipoprotein B-100 isoform X2 [Hyla sarda]|uniref:apolipoprotein B-100 isoform X2 n=1 Tax=Hyla sarda TaxID=327740 RepID=UPI0024C2B3CF|nr:apolipoprotein B-100 isoform X2 [Hyla sarda]
MSYQSKEDGTESQNPSCPKDAIKFRHLRKYTYNYEASTTSGVTGTADSQSGSKFNCKVELEVPQLCNFILRIKQCTLREVYGVSSEGKALYKKAKNSEDFSNAMSKYEVNFSVQLGKQVILYPKEEEPVNILNIKRGIISALLVPDETQQTSDMDTVYGKCRSEISVGKKGSSDVTVTTNLKTCDQFTPVRDHVSPLALFKGLNTPLSTLISSSQSCQYALDAKRRHLAEASCVETHLFLPFSHKNQYGMMAKVTQNLKLEDSSKTNSREFADSPFTKGLALEAAESPSTSEEAVLDNLMELQKVSTSEINQQRANTFHKLVAALRTLNNDTLGPLVPRLMQLSSPITLQALTQCGTPECFGAILQVLRTSDVSPILRDPIIYAIGLFPRPCTKRLREILNMAQYTQSRASFYALGHAVNNFYEYENIITPELRDVADYMSSLIDNECTGDQEKTFLTLKAIGIMGNVLEEVNPQIKSSVLRCVRSQAPSFDVQKAAIQALRKMSVSDDVRSTLVQVFQDGNSPVQKRLAAYLVLMKNPSQSDLRKIVRTLNKDDNEQVKNFVASHIVNIQKSQAPEMQELKGKVEETLKSNGVPTIVNDFTKLSKNYQFSKNVDVPGLGENLGAKVEGNIIYDYTGYMPREVMFETTLNVFGESVDLFEVGVEGKGFEPTLNALFGKDGFFPDCATKALYWADGKVPEKVTEVLYKWFGVSRQDKQNQDLKKAVLYNVEKLIREVRSSGAPEAKAYLEILGKELGYFKLSDFQAMENMMFRTFQTVHNLPSKLAQIFSHGADSDLFVHYIFMDNQFSLPTGSGLQLQVSLSGIVAPGAKAGMKLESRSGKVGFALKPAVSVEFVTQIGIQIPEFSKHAVQMNTNIYHESGGELSFTMKKGQVKFAIPAPTTPINLFSINNKVNLVFASKTEVMPPIIENREDRTTCWPLITGMNYCTSIGYSNASSIDSAPYFPLTGESRYEVKIHPTGEVQEYSLTAAYEKNKEGTDPMDSVRIFLQAGENKAAEVRLTVTYNSDKYILTSNLEIPSANIDFGSSIRAYTEYDDARGSTKTLIAELKNQQVSEVTFTGRLSSDFDNGNGALSAELSIPKLHMEAKADATLKKILSDFNLQLKSSATICALSGSQNLLFTYDNEKVELDWSTTSDSNVKKIISKLPDIRFSDIASYPESLKTYANTILDHKVAQTDMTIRHIASQSIVATKNWIQAASRGSSYAQTLSNKLDALRDLNMQELGIPSLPDNLFLNSDGKIRYKFNKESIIINIPLPLAGKTSHQLVAKTLRSPRLELQSVGLVVPEKEYRIPAFTIPEYYQLRVPLIGVLDLSSNINSNFYNWSASYTGGNTTSDILSFGLRYQVKADSILDILSYNIDGSAQESFDPRGIYTRSFEGSLRHTLLDASIRLNEIFNYLSDQIFKASYSYQARSALGLEFSEVSSVRTTVNNKIVLTECDAKSKLNVASLFANSDIILTFTVNTDTLQTKVESNYKFDSSYLKATNKLSGMFLKEAVTLKSTTDFQDGALVNTMTADYRDRQLTLKSDTNGNYYNLVGLNRFELTVSKQMAAIRSEYQADYKRNRFYTLLSGSLNSLGLELNADVTLNNQGSRGAHKATLKLNQDGLTTSATTSVNFSPLLLESELNADVGLAGAGMKMSASGRYREHSAKISVDGKGSLSELSLGSVCQATLLGVDSKHLLNFRVSKEGLRFSNNLLGSYNQIKLESSNDLSIAGYVLQFTSKFENSLSSVIFHKHKFDFQMQPYTMTTVLNNELKYGALEFTNNGQVQLEAFKVNINGNLRGAYSKDEIKHTYGFSAGNMAANVNTDTIANILGTTHSHRLTLEIAGLSVSFSSSSNCESKDIRFTNRIRSVVQPFTITIDSQTNGDGRLMIFGEQAGQLYSKFILKAEPLSFNLVHDYRGSTKHSFGRGNTHETLLDYNINLLFTPSEQLSSWKLKSRLNQNTYNQEMSAFNNADSIGVQLSGQTLADISILDRQVYLPFVTFNPIDSLNLRDNVNTPQEFSISGHIKYDKNKDMHIINLPFIENMSLYFEKVRSALLTALQALQNSLKDVDIDQYVQRYRRALDTASQRMNDYVNSLDLENKAHLVREKIISMAKEYKITAEEFQSAVEDYFRRVQIRLQKSWAEMDRYINENYDELRKSIEVLIQRCAEKLKAFDNEYKVREKTIEMIQNIQVSVENMNVNDFGQSLAAWIQNVEEQYHIRANIQRLLHQIQVYIQRFNIDQMAQNVKELLQSEKVYRFVKQIKDSVPFESIRFWIEQIRNLVITQLEEFQVSQKFNAVVDTFQDFVAHYEIDKKLEVLIEKFIEFLNQQKVKETIKMATDMLNNIDLRLHCKRVLTFVDSAVKQVRDYDFKKLIDDLNYYLDILVQKMRSFNYDNFVDEFNNKVKMLTETVNQKLKALELPQKAEALRQYLNNVRIVVIEYLQQVRETRLAAIAKWYEDIMTSTVLIEWKTRAIEYLEDTRDRIYAMNIKEECQRYLQQVSQAYQRLVILVTEQWNTMAAKISDFAKENEIQDWVDRVKVLVEEGFVVPEINLKFIMFPAFEVSLRSLREATFRTPYFIVPFTDLEIQSIEINFRNLRSIEIPTRFVTPEFTILNTYKVPSYVIDLNEMKLKVVRIIDQIISSDYTLPSPDILLRDITMSDMGIPEFSIPEIYIPNMHLPEYKIPKLNLENFQFPDIKIPEFQLPKIPHSVSIPTFGKLSGSFKVASPVFTISSLAEVKNSTVTEKSPEMIASLSTEATSVFEVLAFTFGADARISAPLMEQLVLKETVSLSNRHVKVDHFSQVTFASSEIRTEIQTKANLITEKNTAELQNSIIVTLQKRITADVFTKYSHRLNIPHVDISSELELQNTVDTTVDIGRITLLSKGKGNWKWACPLFTDEGTHQADVKFFIQGGNIELSGTNKINDKYLKLDQSLKYNSMFLNFVSIDIMSKADAPNVGNSIATLKGKASISEMKVELEASHNAELSGRSTGTINNKFSFLTRAFEIKLSTANNGNLKVSFPLRLTGRVEFLNNYDLTLSPTVQQVSWQANGRFNQYKVAHTIILGNNEEHIEASLAMNGEANLDFLAIPFSIPEIQVPYTSMKTPEVREFSMWEKTGLKNLLTTTRQNFDLNIKLQYQKNKDVHVIPLPLDAVFDTINSNMKTLNKKFEHGRDKTLNLLVDSYNQAKVRFDKHKVDNQVSRVPRTFRIPGYTIPLVNIEVSSFSAELPAFGYVIPKEIRTPSFVLPMIGFSIPTYKLVIPSLEMPVLHVPNSLRRLSLPKFKLPSGQNGILIPALGNLTYDFFFKSNVISLTTSAGIYNQSDISARVSVASTSVIDALQFNIDATTGLTRKRGLKLATALALKSVFAEGKHESSISFGKKNVEASVITNAKLDTPLLKSTLKQELTGNTKTKSTVSSMITLTYDYNDVLFGNTAKGKLDHTLSLEGLTSYFSVVSRVTGDITGSLLNRQTFSGTLTNDANTYINANSLRSTMRLAANSRVDYFGNLDLTENLAVEASTSRIYAVWEHKGKNYIGITPLFRSVGQQSAKATLELALWSLLADLQMNIRQPNTDIKELNQGITLNVNTDKQEFSMNGHSIVQTLILAHNIKLSNDQTEARVEAGGSLQGNVAFLKSVVLPVYDRSLWDVLKLDVTTAADRNQYLNASTTLIYTKSNDGFFYPIPSERIGYGSTISIPGLTINNEALPEIQFPATDIKLLYTSAAGSKIPLVELSAPQYRVTVFRYTLPKKIFDLDFNSLFNTIADIDLPTIEIPEQKIEIPPIKLTLPAGIYIPAFGSISGSVQFASPVYNITWTNKLENKPDSLVGTIDATSSSTLQFLEFDLDASLAGTLNGRNLNLIGQGSLAHVDLSTVWKEEVSFNGLRLPQHNFQVDITSPTFTNVQIRCQYDENGISSSVSSPSTGTLGLLLEKDSKTIKMKVSSRSAASPEKEVLILKNELSLKNSDKIQNKFNWREDAAQDVLIGLKERLPKMSDAVYNCVNRYHKEHLGMDIKEAGQQMKEHLQTKVSSAYNSASNHIDNLEYNFRSAVRGASGKYADVSKSLQWYQGPSDMSFILNDGVIDSKLYEESVAAIRRYQSTMKDIIDAAITFLKNTRFQLPGQKQKYTGEEQFTMAMKWTVNTMEQFIQKIQTLLETFIQSINDVSFNIPGTNFKIESKHVILAVKDFLKEVQQITKKIFNDLQYVSLERNLQQLKTFVQEVSQKSEKIIEALKSRNYEYMQVQTQQMYNDAMNSQYMQYLSKLAEEIKKSTSQLLKIYQNIYEELLEKLKQLLVYAKALREEYLDPNIVGWSVKYYEIEEKVLQLFKLIIDSLKNLPAQYGINMSEINEQMKASLKDYYEQSKILLTNAEDKGRKQVRELSIKLEQKVSDWSRNAKHASSEYSQILNAKLQETYGKMLRSYEDFLVEANRLLDLIIQKYNDFIEVLSQMLQNFQNSASEEVKTYVSTRKGEVKVEIPHPFDWKSFDEIPQVRRDIIAKRMEIARAMVLEGIEKGSKQWEEMQQLIEKQIEDGKLTAQQVIENIKNWRNKN